MNTSGETTCLRTLTQTNVSVRRPRYKASGVALMPFGLPHLSEDFSFG